MPMLEDQPPSSWWEWGTRVRQMGWKPNAGTLWQHGLRQLTTTLGLSLLIYKMGPILK